MRKREVKFCAIIQTITQLDVLIVYSATLSQSASSTGNEQQHPFQLYTPQANYNAAYEYFLVRCHEAGLSAGLTTSADITGPGTCRSYWQYTAEEGWEKVLAPAQSKNIFDKISPVSEQRIAERALLFSDPTYQPFNNNELFETFCDKLLTYQRLAEFAIPTVAIESESMADIVTALDQLKTLIRNHLHPRDFTDKVILKDRFGASGELVFKVSTDNTRRIHSLVSSNPAAQFILQPFVAFENGYIYKDNFTATDIRCIFHHNTLLQSYIRMAKPHDFRCNEHQGGTVVYVTEAEIPDGVLHAAHSIVTTIAQPESLYALDFIVSNTGHAYFLEGNIGPGLDWNPGVPENVTMSLQLIDSIVGELVKRVTVTRQNA